MKDVMNAYFDWLCDFVCDKDRNRYIKLLSHLHSREFTWSIPLDDNRAFDGLDLRLRFSEDFREEGMPCSMLEMMVALSLRMEEEIMVNLDYGDRTGQWFWSMISSLGLGGMTNSRYSVRKVDRIIDDFLDHEYEPNGKGGLFIVDNCKYDLRNEEIWCQMNWYLNTLEED